MFITLEGIDRSGKSTQAAMLAEALGPGTLLLREPGGTAVGERIRELLKDPGLEMGIGAELMLFSAARAELARSVIGPARREGRDVVCDRYFDSTAAYQGRALGERYAGAEGHAHEAFEAGLALVEQLSALVVGECVPELTLLIRVDPRDAARRGEQRKAEGGEDGDDRFEARGLEFQSQVAAAYDEIARRHPERIAVVDGEGAPDEVHARVMAELSKRR
jgi:dTMP kinase